MNEKFSVKHNGGAKLLRLVETKVFSSDNVDVVAQLDRVDHQVTQVPLVFRALQEQPVSRAFVVGLELLAPQECLEMALQEHLERQEFLDTTDIRVFPVLLVSINHAMHMLEWLLYIVLVRLAISPFVCLSVRSTHHSHL